MSLLDFIPGATGIEAIVIGTVIALAAGAYGLQHHQITTLKAKVAEVQQGRDQDRAAYATAAASATAEHLAKLNQVIADQGKAANEAQIQTERAAVAERAAAQSADGLRSAARALAATSCSAVPSSPAAVASSPADRLADVLAASADRYLEVAKATDRAIIRGKFCEGQYDPLTQ